MDWKTEVYRAFFVAFGAMELLSNLNYLLSNNGVQKARKQHKELPCTVNDKNSKDKNYHNVFMGYYFFICWIDFIHFASTYEHFNYDCFNCFCDIRLYRSLIL